LARQKAALPPHYKTPITATVQEATYNMHILITPVQELHNSCASLQTILW